MFIFMFGNDFGKCGPIFEILSPWFVGKFSMYTSQRFHLTCNMLLHDYRPIFRFISETIQDMATVTMECQQEIVCGMSNGTIFNDVTRLLPIFQGNTIIRLKISQTIGYTWERHNYNRSFHATRPTQQHKLEWPWVTLSDSEIFNDAEHRGAFFATAELLVKEYRLSTLFYCGAVLCISAAYAVMRCLSICPSVRLSVCPSVTFVDHVKTNKHIFEKNFYHRVATPF